MTTPTPEISDLLRKGFAELQAGRARNAADYCRHAMAIDPALPQVHFLIGLAAQDLDDLNTAMRAFGSVTKLDPANAAGFVHLARVFMRLGQPARAEAALGEAKARPTNDPAVADLIGVVSSMLGDQAEARQWYAQAHGADPHNEQFAVNLATAEMFLGDNDGAIEILRPIIEAKASAAHAQWLYSSIIRQESPTRPDRLMADARKAGPGDAAFLAYAAGKEYEDCSAWDKAIEAFDLGARAKRSTIKFDERGEIDRFSAAQELVDETFARKSHGGHSDPSPIFVVGQPRTGTTLIERIITSHSAVESAGELQQFRLSLARMAAQTGGKTGILETIKGWKNLDFAALGREYLRVTKPMRKGAGRFVDKLPGNYFFIPFILAALPDARIVHLTRDPMDACFASYKQLFAEAYLHSYDQREMARHFIRYQGMMTHWRALYPGRFLDVSYEETVADPEAGARRLIDFLGLPFEEACLRYYEQDAAVATASAVQVREKPHTRSVGRWLRYRGALAPMRAELEAGGVRVVDSVGVDRS